MLIKIKKTYDRIFKSAKNAEQNRNINLVDALIDRTDDEGVVASSTDNEDLTFSETQTFYHKGFFCQIFEISGMYKCYAKTETILHRMSYESDLFPTYRKAAQQIMGYIDKFRESKNNDNRVGRN